MEEKTADIFSDGSSRGNPGRGGYGAIVVINDRVIELGGREDDTTNNRMELTGALEGIRLAHSLGAQSVLVHTDSSYTVNAVSKWLKGWVQKDWQTKEGKSVLNRDILECFYDLMSLVEIKLKLIPGHSGVAANERCDMIATSFADRKEIELYDGRKEDYSVSFSLQAGTKKKSSSSNKAKAYSYISEIDGEVKIHKTWDECKSRVEGKRARFKKSLSKENEAEIIEEFGR